MYDACRKSPSQVVKPTDVAAMNISDIPQAR